MRCVCSFLRLRVFLGFGLKIGASNFFVRACVCLYVYVILIFWCSCALPCVCFARCGSEALALVTAVARKLRVRLVSASRGISVLAEPCLASFHASCSQPQRVGCLQRRRILDCQCATLE